MPWLFMAHLESSIFFFFFLSSILFLARAFLSCLQPSWFFSRYPKAGAAMEPHSQQMIVIVTQTISVAFITSNVEKRTQWKEDIFCKRADGVGAEMEGLKLEHLRSVAFVFWKIRESIHPRVRHCASKQTNKPTQSHSYYKAQAKKGTGKIFRIHVRSHWKIFFFFPESKRAILCILFTLTQGSLLETPPIFFFFFTKDTCISAVAKPTLTCFYHTHIQHLLPALLCLCGLYINSTARFFFQHVCG